MEFPAYAYTVGFRSLATNSGILPGIDLSYSKWIVCKSKKERSFNAQLCQLGLSFVNSTMINHLLRQMELQTPRELVQHRGYVELNFE